MTVYAKWQPNAAEGKPPFVVIRASCVHVGCTPQHSASWERITHMSGPAGLDMLGEVLYYAERSATANKLYVMARLDNTQKNTPHWDYTAPATDQILSSDRVYPTPDDEGDLLLQEFLPSWVPREVTPDTTYTFESIYAVCGKHLQRMQAPMIDLWGLAGERGMRLHVSVGDHDKAYKHDIKYMARDVRAWVQSRVPYPEPHKSCWFSDQEKADVPLDLYPL